MRNVCEYFDQIFLLEDILNINRNNEEIRKNSIFLKITN